MRIMWIKEVIDRTRDPIDLSKSAGTKQTDANTKEGKDFR